MSHFKTKLAVTALVTSFALLPQVALAQATITIVNNDGPGEGFNDPTPVTPVAGNPGTTLGEQRLNAFQAAADEWEGVIQSTVEIRIDAALDPLTPCNAAGGVLGRAGTQQIYRNFTNAPAANTWYSEALANAIAGVDNDSNVDDIQARFNSSVDNNNACLNNTNWFYGIGVPTPANTISFFDTVKHELGHGLGVQSFVDVVTTGSFVGGFTDAFTDNLHDHSTGENWSDMTDAERLASAVDTGDLHWTGPRVNNCAATVLTAGIAGGHVRMYAPNPVRGGSSVSHFDDVLSPDELMEPFATPTSDQRLTDRLLADIGWNVTSPPCVTITHNPAISNLHLPLGSAHFPAGSVFHRPFISNLHLPIGSRHFPSGSLHFPAGSAHFPAGSLHFPRGSILHSRIASIHTPLGSVHQPIGSIHGPFTSPGHSQFISNPHNLVSSRFDFDPDGPIINPQDPVIDPRIPGFDPRVPGIDPRGPIQPFGNALHAPVISFQHNPIVSAGHNPLVSQGHKPLASQGHNPILSQGHSPFVSQGHSPFISQGHNPFVSQGHNPFVSQGHSPFVSQGHNPFVSQGHSIVQSQGHNPLVSQGHTPFTSGGHLAILSQGHQPAISFGHQTWLSQGHNPLLSGGGHNRLSSSGGLPDLPDPGPITGGRVTEPQQQAPQPLEQIPGNRATQNNAPVFPGRPYAVPNP